MTDGDILRLEADDAGTRRVFVVKCIHSRDARPFRLYQYDGTDLNRLEFFDVDSHRPSRATVKKKAEAIIRFYLGNDAEISEVKIK